MVSPFSFRFNASDRSYFAIVKKEIHALAQSANFPEKKLAALDIVVAEMVSNLSKHAGGGELLVKLVDDNGLQGIEILCLDNGPGMGDTAKMMVDGASTKNTLGHGLGSIKRFSDIFQIYSQKGWGTILLSRIFVKEQPKRVHHDVEIKSLVIPKPGETACGDGFASKISKELIQLFLGDGLGHGAEAQKAVTEAIEAFKACPDESPLDILRFMHTAVRKTRGLVGTIVILNTRDKCWRICGIGNISTKLHTQGVAKTYLAYNGIIGMNIPNSMKDQEIPFENGQQLIMCSDGIKSRWEISKYPLITRYDLSVLASSLFKDFGRNTDDMSVAACKINL